MIFKRQSVLASASIAALWVAGLWAGPTQAVVAGDCEVPDDSFRQEVDHVYERVGGAALSKLVENPKLRFVRAEWKPKNRNGGDRRLVAEAEIHAVYPVAIERFAHALASVERVETFMPHAVLSEVLCRRGSDPTYYRQHLKTSFGVLFLRVGYDNIIDLFIDWDGSSRYRSWYAMRKSLDGKMADVRGGWYLEPVSIDGEEATYVRHTMRNVFDDPPGVLAFVLRRFSGGQLKDTLKGFYKEAKRLEASESKQAAR